MKRDPPRARGVKDAICLVNLGDNVKADHIFPADEIQKDCKARRFLLKGGVDPKHFESSGCQCGIDETKQLQVFNKALRHKNNSQDTIVLAGEEYGSGSSRDWAAEGLKLLGVKAVIAKSFERTYRSKLAGMGIIPLRFKDDQDANSLKLTCKDRYTISFTATEFSKMRPGDVTVTTNTEKSFTCTARFETQRSRACGVKDAYCLLILGDSITTDHISPAGSIHKDSPAAEYLLERGVDPKNFSSYDSRSGNDEIMARGTFPNIRTRHYPSGEEVSVFDAALRYKNDSLDTIVLAGEGYGSGSSRDWAAKGLMLLGVKAVIAKSFGRIHRSNLVGMGIIPLCFKAGEDARSLELTGSERYTINFTPRKLTKMRPGQDVIVTTDRGKSFKCTVRFDTQMELEYFKHGGILPYTPRQLLSQAQE